MCVIIYKKRGFNIPDKKLLLRAWTANPDGAGFAYNDNKNVYYKKGFTKFKDFYNALLETDTTAKLQNKDLIIHFRIATSGGTAPEKTHPFCVTHSLKKMEQLQGTCKLAFFHNGIISDFASKNYSDTENYTALILANIKNLEQQDTLIDYLARVENSRFALITKNRVLLGNEFLTDNNYFVSNKNYTYYYNTSYNNYDKMKYQYNTYTKDYLYNDYNRLYY